MLYYKNFIYRLKKYCILIFFLLNTYTYSAEFYCDGFLCNTPIVNSALKPISYQLESAYLKQISLAFNESMFALSTLKGFSATGVPKNMDIGLGEGFNHREKESLILQVEQYRLTGLLNTAYSLSPSFYVGFNLGSAVGLFQNKYSRWLDKVGIYLNYMNTKQEISNYHSFMGDQKLEGKIQSTHRGISLRYELIEQFMLFPLLMDFSGVTLEAGYSELNNRIGVRDFLTDMFSFDIGVPNQLIYKRSFLDLDTRSKNKYAEIRSGFRLFESLSFFAGLGARSSALDNTVRAEWLSAFQFEIKQSLLTESDIKAETLIFMNLKNYHSMKIEKEYLKLGTQLEIWNFKFIVEGYTTKGNRTIGAFLVYSF